MNFKEQYASPDLCMLINDRGIRWKASAYYNKLQKQDMYVLTGNKTPFRGSVPAYTLFELGHMIPFGLFNQMKIQKYLNSHFAVMIEDKWEMYTTEADCRARYLIHLIDSRQASLNDVANPVQIPMPGEPIRKTIVANQ